MVRLTLFDFRIKPNSIVEYGKILMNWEKLKKSIHTIESLSLCQLLVEYREAKQITQSELARLLDWKQSHLSKVENGDRRLDLLEFNMIAKVLKIDVQTFFKLLNERIAENKKAYPHKGTMA